MDRIIKSILEMEPNKWIPEQTDLDEKWVKIYGRYFVYMKNNYNIELTFNKQLTKIKKTIWKNGKPV